MARHNEMAMFLAKVPGGNTPDSFTMFCVDSRRHSECEYQRLPREKLHGLRGTDLSGFRLDNCRVEPDCVIDEPGKGLELMLRTSQLHRVGAVTMALGALDTGLRIALSFANSRHIFGQRLADIPITRLELTDTFCDLLLSELVVTAASRALHYAPKAMFLQAAVTKYLVPTFTRQGFARLAGVIGARYYLREAFAYGLFQKAMRDAEMTSFVDGNEKVNLKNIAMHMEVTLPYLQKNRVFSDEEYTSFAAFFDLNQREPDARFSELSVFSGRKDLVLLMLNDSLKKLEARLDQRGLDAATSSSILELAWQIPADIVRLREQMQAQKAKLQKNYNYSPQSYRLAKKYALLHAAAICVHVAVHTDLQPLLAELAWLPVCLLRVRRHLNADVDYPSDEQVERVFTLVQRQFDQGLMFGFMPIRIAENPDAFCDPHHMNT